MNLRESLQKAFPEKVKETVSITGDFNTDKELTFLYSELDRLQTIKNQAVYDERNIRTKLGIWRKEYERKFLHRVNTSAYCYHPQNPDFLKVMKCIRVICNDDFSIKYMFDNNDDWIFHSWLLDSN